MRQKIHNQLSNQPNSQNQPIGKDEKTNGKVSASDPSDYEYKSKVKLFKKRIIFNLSAFTFFAIFISATYFFGQNAISENESDIRNLNARIADLTNKSGDIESRINEVKKYNKIWTSADEKRKNPGKIKISDINDRFNLVAAKYNLSLPKITIAAPEALKGSAYDNESFEVQLVNCTIEFKSLTDRVAINFVNDFLGGIPGYVVISSLEIKKNKKEAISDADLAEIKAGTNLGLVSSRAAFSWYFLKDKPQATK